MRVKLLLVDDMPNTTKLALARLLSHPDLQGVEFVWETAESGADALQILEIFKRSLPHAVLSDYQMKEMDGLQLTARIKQAYPRLPVLIMTANEITPDLSAAAVKAGAKGILHKPVQAKHLVAWLRLHVISDMQDKPQQGEDPRTTAARQRMRAILSNR